jgi:hypothetical protein
MVKEILIGDHLRLAVAGKVQEPEKLEELLKI